MEEIMNALKTLALVAAMAFIGSTAALAEHRVDSVPGNNSDGVFSYDAPEQTGSDRMNPAAIEPASGDAHQTTYNNQG